MATDFRTRLVTSLILRWGLLRRAVTLGVRILVEDPAGRILLVRHTYVAGWHFPGGGVDPGESILAAALREVREETGVVLPARPTLFGIYRNTAGTGRDHVALFRASLTDGAIRQLRGDAEIAELGWFSRDALPEGTTRGTKARLLEIFDGAPLSETW